MTGAAGFRGRVLVPMLRERDERVVAIDRHPVVSRPGVAVVTADLMARRSGDCGARRGDGGVPSRRLPGVRATGPGARWRRHPDNILATAAVLDRLPLDVAGCAHLLLVGPPRQWRGCSVGGKRPGAVPRRLH